jgi:ATP-binding cassette subfamily B protein
LPIDIKRAHADTHTTAQLADSITNNINIKTFTSYESENKRFAKVTHDQFLLRKKSWNLGTAGEIVQGLSMIVLEFLIIYYAVKFWQVGKLNIGDLSLLLAYFIRIVDKLWNTGKNIRNIYEAIADANEMTEMLLQPHAVNDLPGAIVLDSPKGNVEFKDVSFGYHTGDNIFQNFNLNIRSGERVAFIGPSGGGKSTILKLLLRFYDVQSGVVSVDGQNIATVTQDSLRSAISLVPQDPILFHRTLAENIRYAKPDATDEDVIRVAKLAHAHEFIEKSENGYATLVGERGIKLSGGERQRIAIARAILKDAPILILDEATSSLDSESEMFIQDALKNLMKNRTTIVVAHRLSTIMQMDRIIVIADGKIIEEGKHAELLKANQGTYQKLWHIQAGGFAGA